MLVIITDKIKKLQPDNLVWGEMGMAYFNVKLLHYEGESKRNIQTGPLKCSLKIINDQ
jgi:hypothetical protein